MNDLFIWLTIVLHVVMMYFVPQTTDTLPSLLLFVVSVGTLFFTFRKVGLWVVLITALTTVAGVFYPHLFLEGIAGIAILLGMLFVALVLLESFLGKKNDLSALAFFTTLPLAILGAYGRYLYNFAPPNTTIIFVGHWVLVPVSIALYLFLNRKKEKEEQKRKDREYDFAVDMGAVQAVLSEYDTANATPFDVSLTDTENRTYWKWLTLDEQYEYFSGLHDTLINRYKVDFMERYNDPDLFKIQKDGRAKAVMWLENPFHRRVSDHLKERGINIYPWFMGMVNDIKPFRNYLEAVINNGQILKDYSVVARGIRGEDALDKELSFIGDNFKILQNVRIVVDDLSAESDALVFSPNGIFTIEAKNFSEEGSYSIQISKDGKWTKVIGNKRYEMKDVVAQNNRHVLLKQRFLNRELKKRGLISEDDYIDIEGLITITNDVVDIQNDTDFPVMRLSHIYSHIRKHPVIYTQEQLQSMYDIFKENMLPAQKFPVTDYVKQYEAYRDYAQPRLDAYYKLRKVTGIDRDSAETTGTGESSASAKTAKV